MIKIAPIEDPWAIHLDHIFKYTVGWKAAIGVVLRKKVYGKNTSVRVSFLIKLQETLFKKRLRQRCFPVNFAKFLSDLFLQNTSRRLFLWNVVHNSALVCFNKSKSSLNNAFLSRPFATNLAIINPCDIVSKILNRSIITATKKWFLIIF